MVLTGVLVSSIIRGHSRAIRVPTMSILYFIVSQLDLKP